MSTTPSQGAPIPKGEPRAPALPQGAPVHKLQTSGRPPFSEDLDVLRTNFADQDSESHSQESTSDLEYRLNEDLEDDKSFHRKDDKSFQHEDDKSFHREKSPISSTPHPPGRYMDSAQKKRALEQDSRRVKLPETPLKPAMKQVVLQEAETKQVRHAAHASSERQTPRVQVIRPARSISPDESIIHSPPQPPASISNQNQEHSRSHDIPLPDFNQLSISNQPEPQTRRNTQSIDASNILSYDAQPLHPSQVGLEISQPDTLTRASAAGTHLAPPTLTNQQTLPPVLFRAADAPLTGYSYGRIPLPGTGASEVPAYSQAIDLIRSWNPSHGQVPMYGGSNAPSGQPPQSQYPYSVHHPNPSNQVMYTAPFPPATYPPGIPPTHVANGHDSGSAISDAKPRRGRSRSVMESFPTPHSSAISQSRQVDPRSTQNLVVNKFHRVYHKEPEDSPRRTEWFESEGPFPLDDVPYELIARTGISIGSIRHIEAHLGTDLDGSKLRRIAKGEVQ
ncbi:hypothetical protein BDN72DRAFT_896177 [Pluteus cervinus]|uniref:Uncharacterized protein n=1 Tax=Pluteus cervinus TaxID=181527 RepID=A0ACD3AZF2_9AGAR|nr:hypothetical protein BDN72DRAFT_896177 [Pluteus cervinus]